MPSLRLLLAIMFLMALVPLPAVARTPVATPTDDRPPLDLAAHSLRPADLDAVGFAGFGLDRGVFVPSGDPASGLLSVADASTATPSATGEAGSTPGWRSRYDLALVRPSEADPFTPGARVVASVTLASDADDADTLARSLVPTGGETVTVALGGPDDRLAGTTATVVTAPVTLPGADAPVAGVTAVVAVGDLVAAVQLADATALDPEPSPVVLLLESLARRVAGAEPDTTPALAGLVLDLDPGERPFAYTDDKYELLGGDPLPLVRETELGLRSRVESYGGATEVYSRYRAFDANDIDPADDPYAVVRLLRFADPAAADAYLDIAAGTVSATGGAYERVAPVEGAATFGDASRTYEYRFRASPEVRIEGYVVFVRVGEIVARVQVDARPAPDLVTVESLAARQAEALRD